MTKLNRVTGKVFGGDATATGDNPEIGQFGSALAGTYNGTTDVATIQNLPAWGQGWAGAVTPETNFPALPEMTGFGKVLSYQSNYLLQNGMAEWDNDTIYYINQFCRVGNIFYYSLTDENRGNDPTTDTTNWASFNGQFADISASNFNTTGTANLAGLVMPTRRYIDLDWGSSGTTFTAPANGWVVLHVSVKVKDTETSALSNTVSLGYSIGDISLGGIASEANVVMPAGARPGGVVGDISVILPVKKGSQWHNFGSSDLSNSDSRLAMNQFIYRFVYADGVPSE